MLFFLFTNLKFTLLGLLFAKEVQHLSRLLGFWVSDSLALVGNYSN